VKLRRECAFGRRPVNSEFVEATQPQLIIGDTSAIPTCGSDMNVTFQGPNAASKRTDNH
jgi:hypothetical protein